MKKGFLACNNLLHVYVIYFRHVYIMKFAIKFL